MRVKLYGLFADNYVRAVASLCRGSVDMGTEVEIPDNELEGIKDVAVSLLKEKETLKAGKQRFMSPFKGGENGEEMKSFMRCLELGEGEQSSHLLSYVLGNFRVGAMNGTATGRIFSFMKPDLYEFKRIPGKGRLKVDVSVTCEYAALSVMGWVLTWLGDYKASGQSFSVHLFPIGVDSLFAPVMALVKNWSKKGLVPGIAPLPAFALWLAYYMVNYDALIPRTIVYVMSKQNSRVVEGYWLELGRLEAYSELFLDEKGGWMLRAVAEDALSADSPSRNFSANFSNLAYQPLNGAGTKEELLYRSSREYYSLLASKSKLDEEKVRAYKYAAIVAGRIYSLAR